MSKVSCIVEPDAEAQAEERARRLAAAIVTMLEPISARERDRVLQLVIEMLRPIHAPRAGEVLSAIVLAFPQRPKWTAEEVRQSVEAQGIEATAREVYNALGYLVRKGHIRRVGYGQYMIAGAGIEIEDGPDGTVRESEHFN